MTKFQKSVLIGTLMGDASTRTSKTRTTYGIRYLQGEVNYDYLMHLYDIFKEFVGTPQKKQHILIPELGPAQPSPK